MREVVIVDGARTPFVKAGTDFASLDVIEMSAPLLRDFLYRLPMKPEEIGDVVGSIGFPDHGNQIQKIAERAGIPTRLSDCAPHSVQRNCASGMQAIVDAYKTVALGEADAVVALGAEHMSSWHMRYPEAMKHVFVALARAKKGAQRAAFLHFAKLTLWQLRDIMMQKTRSPLMPALMYEWWLTDPIAGVRMGDGADTLAREYGVSRMAQDVFALQSHMRASTATKAGIFAQEIIPVFVPAPGKFVSEDNGIRHNQTSDALAKLPPFFDPRNGTVTAGNSSQLTDGAAAVCVAAKEVAEKRGWPVLGKIDGYAFSVCDPVRFGIGPVRSTAKVLAKTGFTMADMELIELNEAFAAQVLSVLHASASEEESRKIGCAHAPGTIPEDLLNVNGGAVALGHPIGASGIRIVLTLLKEMERRGLHRGLAMICIGGGQGGSMIVSRA